jgi:tetratricopeptide (TPR) repeat protein
MGGDGTGDAGGTGGRDEDVEVPRGEREQAEPVPAGAAPPEDDPAGEGGAPAAELREAGSPPDVRPGPQEGAGPASAEPGSAGAAPVDGGAPPSEPAPVEPAGAAEERPEPSDALPGAALRSEPLEEAGSASQESGSGAEEPAAVALSAQAAPPAGGAPPTEPAPVEPAGTAEERSEPLEETGSASQESGSGAEEPAAVALSAQAAPPAGGAPPTEPAPVEPAGAAEEWSEPTQSLAGAALREGAPPGSEDSSRSASEPTVRVRDTSASEPTVRVAAGAQDVGAQRAGDGSVRSDGGGLEPTVRVAAGAQGVGAQRAGDAASDGGGSEPAGSLAGEDRAAGAPPVGQSAPEEIGRSALAAALLNLTGLGLGYLYLRRWLRATAAIVILALMVVVAFANDAAGTPWLWRILAALWVAATALDAWTLARRLTGPDTRVQWLRPVAVGFVAVLAVVAGHIGYAEAARATYATGLAAQARADCTEATRAFGAVSGPYELTLSRDVPAAALRNAECTEFTGAEGFEQSGAHAEAVAAYQAFRRDHAGSLLDPFARENTRRVLRAWAVELRGAGDLDGAIARYRELLRELGSEPGTAQVREDLAATHVERASAARVAMVAAAGSARVTAMRAAMDDLLLVGRELADTGTAAGIPQAVLDTYAQANSAYTEGRFCDALPVLDYAVSLPAAAGVASTANGDRARSLSECGLANFNAGDYSGATERFQTLVAVYPNDPGVPQARAALITAEVGRAAGMTLPLPAPIDAPASEPVVVYNAAATEVRVLVAGPTAQELTLPPCPGCPASYVAGAESCPGAAGRPSSSIRLRPGTYYVLQDRAELGPDESVRDPITVQSGGGELCVTVTSTQ